MAWGYFHGKSTWQCVGRCALIAALASGCSDAPIEAPPSEARPLSSLRTDSPVTRCDHSELQPELIPLPPVAAISDTAAMSDAQPPGKSQPSDEDPSEPASAPACAQGPSLLPPMELAALDFTELKTEAPAVDSSDAAAATAKAAAEDADNPHMTEAQALLADASPMATGSPTGAIVSERAQAKIRRGYALGQRGASFAARSEFIQVLRMIAQAKDHAHGAPRRSTALANGLRALEEAADFAPRGPGLDASLSVELLVSSHRTPVAKTPAAAELMPQQLADLYFRYAQLQLGGAVVGEPAGSMALHALGKVYSQLGRTEADAHPQADRCAFALQRAALLARDDNHLAAHELGVLLAESGHYLEAEHLLAQVASRQPHPVVFRNWARVQRKLGREHLAAASEQHAQVLAARNAGGGMVTWVPPAALAQTGDAMAPAAPPAHVAAAPPAQRQHAANSPAANLPAANRPVMARPVQNVTRLPGGYLR